ncbi:MAG: peptide chain release factor 1 [Dehalococcoidia bacterium]|nr:peptide chain release factor 1 [Dehalococcoidia bacterium]
MIDRLSQIEKRFNDIEHEMAVPETAENPRRLQALARERAGLEDVVMRYRQYQMTARSLDELRELLINEADDEMRTLIKQETASLEKRLEQEEEELKKALLPKDPNDERDVIMEIRAGTGGDEAGIFAADLFRMYSRYAQLLGWQAEVIDRSEPHLGSLKEIVFEVRGRGAFSRLKYERGVHRVQRVPTTEASGRIHTSTATVAVLPEADEVEMDIDPADLKIDIFHSGGAGGQNVNKVATAVRITHLPTNTVVVCQDERSQLRNRQKAMAVLRARLLDAEREKRESEISAERRCQVGSGERAEKIRTYNFPQDRITDHRTGLTIHNLPRVLEGYLDELINAVAASEQAKQLEANLV